MWSVTIDREVTLSACRAASSRKKNDSLIIIHGVRSGDDPAKENAGPAQQRTQKAPPSMTAKKRITVLLADHHAIFREGLKHLLDAESDIEVIGEAATGREAVKMTRKYRPVVVVMETAMPQMNGLEATRQIRKAFPDTKVIILSAQSDVIYVKHAKAFGASCYLLKEASVRVLFAAIRKVHQGAPFFSPGISTRLHRRQRDSLDRERLHKAKYALLSTRETEVLKLTAQGLANNDIASALGISAKTSEKHRYRLMQKLTIHNTAGLTRYAIGTGVIDSGAPLTASSRRSETRRRPYTPSTVSTPSLTQQT